LEDATLVRRMLEGDERAFDEFFDMYFDRVFRFALRRTRDEDAAEEMAQATLVRAMRKLDTWRGEATLFTWLCAICRRELMAYWTHRNTAALGDGPAERGTLDRLQAPTDGPEQAMQRHEISEIVHAVLDELPDRYGDLLEWKYIEGQAVSEIALRVGSTPKAVESMLTRARQAFRVVFEQLARMKEAS
jgi:RNA polymerase sigma-70 factor (ECF subfamily)